MTQETNQLNKLFHEGRSDAEILSILQESYGFTAEQSRRQLAAVRGRFKSDRRELSQAEADAWRVRKSD